MSKKQIDNNNFYEQIKVILQKARDKAYKQVNFITAKAY